MTMSSDTANAMQPRRSAPSTRERTRATTSAVDRPLRKPNELSCSPGSNATGGGPPPLSPVACQPRPRGTLAERRKASPESPPLHCKRLLGSSCYLWFSKNVAEVVNKGFHSGATHSFAPYPGQGRCRGTGSPTRMWGEWSWQIWAHQLLRSSPPRIGHWPVPKAPTSHHPAIGEYQIHRGFPGRGPTPWEPVPVSCSPRLVD